jgi:SM-20-related protein
MPPNPKSESTLGQSSEPLLEVIEELAPGPLHSAAWEVCSGKGWYFGHGSHEGDWSRFWKMELAGDRTFDAIWEHVRPSCEALAGAPLRVIRQYANGHTYGLGGQPHLDDHRPGSYTLLYYPNPEWKDGWDGETVFYDAAGEIALAVRPRPNRAIFFDSRILHAGRAPGRLCPALRVTVAYKLQAVGTPAPEVSKEDVSEEPAKATLPAVPLDSAPAEDVSCSEVVCSEVIEKRDGASRVYHLRVRSSMVEQPVEEHLARLGKTVRLPGFRPGKIPMAVLQPRYGAQARAEAINRIVAETMQRALPKGSIVSSFALHAGVESGDVEFQAKVTYLPDLPPVDFSTFSIERLTASSADLQSAGLSSADAAALFRQHLKLQVLDLVDAAYQFPLLPFLVEREFATIWKTAEAQDQIPPEAAVRERLAAEFRSIAERRLRLGMVVAEIARRNGIRAQHSAELEDNVVDLLVNQAGVGERHASVEELRELMEEE